MNTKPFSLQHKNTEAVRSDCIGRLCFTATLLPGLCLDSNELGSRNIAKLYQDLYSEILPVLHSDGTFSRKCTGKMQ